MPPPIPKKFAEKTETKHYYIGATEDLDTRWSKYKDWQYKQVIYETSSYEIAKKAEEDLIKFANRTYDNCNKIPHSKGLKEGAKIYYIYMLGDKACKLRN